jgi:hypothetical protein
MSSSIALSANSLINGYKLYATQFSQGVKKLGLKLLPLICGCRLKEIKTGYPAVHQAFRYCVCCYIRDGDGVRPAPENIYLCKTI